MGGILNKALSIRKRTTESMINVITKSRMSDFRTKKLLPFDSGFFHSIRGSFIRFGFPHYPLPPLSDPNQKGNRDQSYFLKLPSLPEEVSFSSKQATRLKSKSFLSSRAF